MLALLNPLVKTTKLEVSGNNEELMNDLAKETRLQKHLQEVKVLRRNPEEVPEDQPLHFSKSFFPFSLFFLLLDFMVTKLYSKTTFYLSPWT